MHQVGYGANNLVGTEEALANLVQASAEFWASVTYLTDTNMNLTTQVAENSNNTATKDAAMATMQKTISQIQGEFKTLKRKISGQATKKPDTYGYKKGNWWSNPYFWTHGVGQNDGEA